MTFKATNFNTLCVHGGGIKENMYHGITTPIVHSTSYRYRETDKRGYPRYFQAPNQEAVIEKLCQLEHVEAGVLVSSGMAAISTAIIGLVKAGQHVVIQAEVYGGTAEFFANICAPLNIKCSFVGTSVSAIVEAITDDTAMIYLECPTNPTLAILDIAKLVESIKHKHIVTVIDNTFATPINQNPALLGIDIVIHSGTKFLSGHSDLCCGVILGAAALIDKIRITARSLGGSLNANDCYLLERSLKTLNLRVTQQTVNAQTIAEYLEQHSDVLEVRYPGLKTDQYHVLAQRQMRNYGSMIAFKLTDNCDSDVFMDSLSLIIPASSLGGVETIVSAPWYGSHQKVSEKKKQQLGITKNLLRLSVGIEDVEDLLQDLQWAIQSSRNVDIKA